MTTLRIAVNDRVKRGEEWQDAAYWDVTVWGRTAENCAQYLQGPPGRRPGVDVARGIAQDGDEGQSVEVVADNDVQFLGGRKYGESQFVPAGAGQTTEPSGLGRRRRHPVLARKMSIRGSECSSRNTP